jgi:uncharacterized FlgJ-related protein
VVRIILITLIILLNIQPINSTGYTNTIDYCEPVPFTAENLYSFIVKINIKHPDIVMAQALLETGRFKSTVFNRNHNLFGMKQPRLRTTTSKGRKGHYAEYDNWQSSVIDYKLWQDRMIHKGLTRKAYFNYLRKHYAEDSMYVIKINIILHRK